MGAMGFHFSVWSAAGHVCVGPSRPVSGVKSGVSWSILDSLSRVHTCMLGPWR